MDLAALGVGLCCDRSWGGLGGEGLVGVRGGLGVGGGGLGGGLGGREASLGKGGGGRRVVGFCWWFEAVSLRKQLNLYPGGQLVVSIVEGGIAGSTCCVFQLCPLKW